MAQLVKKILKVLSFNCINNLDNELIRHNYQINYHQIKNGRLTLIHLMKIKVKFDQITR